MMFLHRSSHYYLGEWMGVILDEAQGKNGKSKKKEINMKYTVYV